MKAPISGRGLRPLVLAAGLLVLIGSSVALAQGRAGFTGGMGAMGGFMGMSSGMGMGMDGGHGPGMPGHGGGHMGGNHGPEHMAAMHAKMHGDGTMPSECEDMMADPEMMQHMMAMMHGDEPMDPAVCDSWMQEHGMSAEHRLQCLEHMGDTGGDEGPGRTPLLPDPIGF